MRALWVASCALALAGCSGDGEGPERPGPAFLRSAPETVDIAGGDIVVGGPPGYCIDRRSSRPRATPAFVLLASCASLTGRLDAGAPDAPGLLTASVDAEADPLPSAEELRSLLTSDAGRATLAQDGQAASVTILESATQGGAVILKIRDDSTNGTPGLSRTYWRGLFTQRNRLITVTVFAFETRPIGTDAGRHKLEAFIARIRAASPEASKTEDPSANGPGGLFRRFLN